MSPQQRSAAWAGLVGVLFLAVEVIGAHLKAGYSAYQIVWMRYAVHTGLMSTWLIFSGRAAIRALFEGEWLRQIPRSLLMLAMPACWSWGWAHGADPVALAAGLAATPLIAAIILFLSTRGPVGARNWIGPLLSCAGAVLVTLGRPHSAAGLVSALGAASCLAAYIVKTADLSKVAIGTSLFHTAFWVLLVLTPAQPGLWVAPPLPDLPLFLAIGSLGLILLLALDHMSRGPDYVSATSLINLQIAAPLWLAAQPRGSALQPLTFAGLLLIAASAAWSITVWRPFARTTRFT